MNRVNSIFITTRNADAMKAACEYLRDKKKLIVLVPEANSTIAVVLSGAKKDAAYKEYSDQRNRICPNLLDRIRDMSTQLVEETDKVLNSVKYELGKKYFELEKRARRVEATPENLENIHTFMTQA